MEDRYWKSFTETGSVTDYLYYRGMDICRQVIERREADDAGRTGGIDSESSYRDRDGAESITYR